MIKNILLIGTLVLIAMLVVGGAFYTTRIFLTQTVTPSLTPSPTNPASTIASAPRLSCTANTSFTNLGTALKNPDQVCALTLFQSADAQTFWQNPAPFSRLESLTIASVGLTALPPTVAQLPSLKILDLHNNKLTTLPAEILAHSSLELIIVRGNPLTTEMLQQLRQHTKVTII